MNKSREEKALENLVGQSFMKHSFDAKAQREKIIAHIISQGKMPENGFDDTTLSYFIHSIACLDTNNFIDNVGVGEREGRVFSKMVFLRHYGMSHGIGRSGNLYDLQPKAMGSSALYTLCNKLVCHAITLCGVKSVKKCLVLPVATGMAMTLCFLTLKRLKPQAKFILWSRIDQKSCFKCILTAGCHPIIIDTIVSGDHLKTNTTEIENKIQLLGPENILCVVSTTSCFSPRTPDSVEDVASICFRHSVYHVVNNAYGLQHSGIVHAINKAILNNRSEVSYVVQSTDKNFMVPVGGSIIFSKNTSQYETPFLDLLAETYPGRASISPIFDLCITLLEMGQRTWIQLLKDRKNNFKYLMEGLRIIETSYSDYIRILSVPKNDISIAITTTECAHRLDSSFLWNVAQSLYYKHISGARYVKRGKDIRIDAFSFNNWGQHNNNYSHQEYLTFSVSIGMMKKEVDEFLLKLSSILNTYTTRLTKLQ